ncbi:hypothetical protein KEM56_003290 [Ascosphaera pollenicola]|nr:hypothetical protein KEM56_003290 [Ascosphaera pollenicola]
MPLKHELPSIRTRHNFCPASDPPIDEAQHMQVFGHVEISLKRPAAPQSASDSPGKAEDNNSSTVTEGEKPTDTNERASNQHESEQIPRAHPTDWPLGPTDGTVLMTPIDLVASKEDNSPVLEGRSHGSSFVPSTILLQA